MDISIVCNTSTGCVLGGSGLGSGRHETLSPGETAANEILKPLLTGACVDEHTQDQVRISEVRKKSYLTIMLFITDDNSNGTGERYFED